MKKLYVLLCLLGCAFCDADAQSKNFQLNIHHMLKTDIFELGNSSENNLAHRFQYTRLEYYISEISIIHDGGQETLIEDLWVLANASDQVTEVDLGIHDISSVEGVSLHIGVDPEHNHLDPAMWPDGHPLAPQFPSMHWGWASGYRFVALEGYGGDGLDQLFQLHGLGDANYEKTTINLSSKSSGDKELIELNADYSGALENIPLNGGMIVHSDNAEAQLSVNNFNRFVFTPYNATSNIENLALSNDYKIFPNPVKGDYLNIINGSADVLRYQISDMQGRLMISAILSDSQINVSNLETGIYVLSLFRGQENLGFTKILIE